MKHTQDMTTLQSSILTDTFSVQICN